MIFAACLMLGCAPRPPTLVADPQPNFCDIETPRRFTQAELDWRATNAPGNLRLDFNTNLAFEQECPL